MEDEPEMIREQMRETRAALSEKLETLEHQVVETVQGATTAVSETVENVKEAVQETVHSVQEAVSLSRQVDRHPWLMMGGAVALGFLGGRLLFSRSLENGSGLAGSPPHLPEDAGHNGGFARLAADAATSVVQSGNGDSASGKESFQQPLGPELSELKAWAVGSALGVARDLLKRSLPTNIAASFGEVMDSMTRKLGGTPIHGSALEEDLTPPSGATRAASAESTGVRAAAC
jgi:ElaB/YqjD/DUF883 family membrane-anchored ribosome-binding protein